MTWRRVRLGAALGTGAAVLIGAISFAQSGSISDTPFGKPSATQPTPGMNVQAAGDAARFHHGQASNELDLESKLYDLVGPQLESMGHVVNRETGDSMGGYQAILFERDPGARAPKAGNSIKGDPPVNGVYRAGSDFRKDGAAIGW